MDLGGRRERGRQAGRQGGRDTTEKGTHCVLVGVLQGSLYFEELAYTIVGRQKSKFSRAGQQVRNWTGPDVTVLRQNFSFLGPSNKIFNWMRLTRIIEDNL